jgi:hypothetical protein
LRGVLILSNEHISIPCPLPPPPRVCNISWQLFSVCSSGIQTTQRTSDDAKGAQRRKATMNRRRLNTGNVLLNFYFVIQHVLFIFILVCDLFHSTSLQLIAFESLKQHHITVHGCSRPCASFRVPSFLMQIRNKYIPSTVQHYVHSDGPSVIFKRWYEGGILIRYAFK